MILLIIFVAFSDSFIISPSSTTCCFNCFFTWCNSSSYLLEYGEDGEPTGLNAGRYEFWLYRQIRKRFQAGEF